MSDIISNVESVTTAAKIVSAQKVETSQLCINGKDLQALKEERAPSYKELVTRMNLPEDEIWALYTDSGDIVYWHNADKMNTSLAHSAFTYAGFNQLPKGLNYEKMVTGYYTFYGCKNLTSVKQDFPALNDSTYMFNSCSNLKSFGGDLGNLRNGIGMFMYSGLETFETSHLLSLKSGVSMFSGTKLSSFDTEIKNIESSLHMFSHSKVITFNSDMPLATDASGMFYGVPSLVSFKGNLDSLQNGMIMFEYDSALTTLDTNFPSLIDGNTMFYGCSSLTSFMCKLKADDAEYSPLTNGNLMFFGCQLDAPSVENILTSLQPFTDGSEHIMTMQIQSAAVEKFNEITGNNLTLNSAYQNVPFRGWTVQVAII